MSRWSKGTLDHDGDGRMGGSRKGNPMTKERDAAETQAYEQGKHARTVSIGRDQSPQVGNLLKHWQAGWDDEDALRESDAEQAQRVAQRDADRLQAEADAAKKALKQTETVSNPKAKAGK